MEPVEELVKGKCSSTKPTRLATGVVCHPDSEQNRPYKIPWPCRELSRGPTAPQARTLPVCHTTPLNFPVDSPVTWLDLRPNIYQQQSPSMLKKWSWTKRSMLVFFFFFFEFSSRIHRHLLVMSYYWCTIWDPGIMPQQIFFFFFFLYFPMMTQSPWRQFWRTKMFQWEFIISISANKLLLPKN